MKATRKSPRRYKPSHGKIFFKFEKSSRCGGLVQAKGEWDCLHRWNGTEILC